MAPASKYPMIEVRAAVEKVVTAAKKLYSASHETCSIIAGLGRVAADDVVAKVNVPSLPASIKDGYAIVSSDPSTELQVQGEVFAAQQTGGSNTTIDKHVRFGTTCYVTTGAVLPPGYDAVVEVEQVEILELGPDEKPVKIRVPSSVPENQDVREPGSDLRIGDVLLRKGMVISSSDIGLLAMGGVGSIDVFKKTIVGIASTGDELVDILQHREVVPELKPGQVYDCNRPTLLALCKDNCAGNVEVRDLGLVKDSSSDQTCDNPVSTLFDNIQESEIDVVITTGGVSMGAKDLVKPELEARGHVEFGRLNMKPGKPTTFGIISKKTNKSTLVFALPGNPVSAVVAYQLLVLPALKILSGNGSDVEPAMVPCTLQQDLTPDISRPEYHRVVLQSSKSGLMAKSTGFQRSSRLASLRDASALVLVPPGKNGGWRKSDTVNAILLQDLRTTLHSAAPSIPDFKLAIGVVVIIPPTSAQKPDESSVVAVLRPILGKSVRSVEFVEEGSCETYKSSLDNCVRAGNRLVVTVVATGSILPSADSPLRTMLTDWVLVDGFATQMRDAAIDAGNMVGGMLADDLVAISHSSSANSVMAIVAHVHGQPVWVPGGDISNQLTVKFGAVLPQAMLWLESNEM